MKPDYRPIARVELKDDDTPRLVALGVDYSAARWATLHGGRVTVSVRTRAGLARLVGLLVVAGPAYAVLWFAPYRSAGWALALAVYIAAAAGFILAGAFQLPREDGPPSL